MKIWGDAINLILNMDKTLVDILSVTFRMAISSSVISLIIGIPIGIIYGYKNFKIKNFFIILNRTLMGMPPVVCGLLCYLMFSGVGPLRHLRLLYTVEGMIIAQVLLITPIVIGTMEPFVRKLYPEMKDTIEGIHIKGFKKILLLINESKYEIVSVYLFALSRALAEVGAVSMVGGAIIFKTNVMTTAIMNYTNMGDFNMAMALGIILMLISLIVNIFANILQSNY